MTASCARKPTRTSAAIATKPLRVNSRMLALEPRYVFDAAIATELHDLAHAAPEPGHPAAGLAHSGDSIVAAANELAAIEAARAPFRDVNVEKLLDMRVAAHNLGASNHEIAFIDSRLADLGALISAIPDGTRIVLIDGTHDGVEQMVEALKGEHAITGIHILSHGSEGQLRLGAAVLDEASMSGIYRSALSSLRGNLASGADILVYGCNFAAGDKGATAVELLASLTGADVAASEDLTGAGDLGGNWSLEEKTGLIETRSVSALEWESTLAPLILNAQTAPIINLGTASEGTFTGVGTVVTWQNAGTVGGEAVDLRATVTSFTGTAAPTFHIGGTSAGSLGNNPGIFMWSQGEMTVTWEIYKAGTDVRTVGTPDFRITDIDGISGAINTREVVTPSLNGLTQYTVSTPTNLVVSISAGGVAVSGTQNQNGESTSRVGFVWNEVSSWSMTYNNYVANAYFSHDGDGEFTFTTGVTSYLLTLDLDGNNSTSNASPADTGYRATYTENGAGVPVVDGDVTIAQHVAIGTNLGGATIKLTNAHAGDELLVGGSSAPSGTINGISYAIASSGGQITVTLAGTASIADYQSALQAITFHSTSSDPSTLDRTIEVSVTNTTFQTTSNTAIATISVVAVNDPPVLGDPDPAAGTPAVDPANPANLLVPATDGTPLSLPLAPYFTDPNGDPLSITPDMSALPSWLSYDPVAQTFSGTPPVDNAGAPIVIPVTVDDGKGGVTAATITITPANPGPVANPDTTSTASATPVVVDLAGNDTDPDSDPLRVTAASLADPASGTLTNAGGVWTFTPAIGFAGPAVINYTIEDQDGATSSSTHTVTVGPNAPPVLGDPDPAAGTPAVDPANPANLLVPATDGTPLSLPLAPYFTDPNGDPLSITPDMSALPSWLSYDPASQTFSGTPPVDNAGAPVVIPVTVDDGKGGVTAATITITPANPGPDAVDGNSVGIFGQSTALPLLANDRDPDGDPLTVTSASVDPAKGTVALVGADWVFTPVPGFTGIATITYTITDGDGGTDTAVHALSVAPPAAPVAVNDRYTIGFGQVLNGDVTGNDTVAPGSTFLPLSQPGTGTLVFNSNGTYVYTPEPGFVGTETFVYQVTDPAGQTSIAVEVIRVTPPTLVAVNDDYSTSFEAPLSGNAAAGDSFAVGSTFIAITAPAHGTLAFNADGTYVYTPTAGFSGVDMFAYAVTDPLGQTRFATDMITVLPPPAPIAVDDGYSTGYRTPVLGNAAAGDSYQPGATFAAISQPTHGTLVFNPDGTFTYAPSAGFAGTDTFSYRVTDSRGNSSTATESIAVSAPALHAVDDRFSGIYGAPIAGNAAAADTFVAGSTFAVATPPAHGTAVMNANGTYVYTAAAGFTGTDTFTYRVTDPTGQSVLATETIVIAPPGMIAADDRLTGAFNSPVRGNAALGDTVAPGSIYSIATAPSVGTVTMKPDGTYTFTPPPTFVGTLTFSYRVTDPTGQSATAVETIVVAPPQLVAVDDTFATPFGTVLSGNAATGDTYAAGSIFAAASSPAHGSVTMNADGTYQYIPAAAYSGTDTFTYTITDPTGQTVTATETIVIAPRPVVHQCLTTFGNLSSRIRR